MESTPSADQPVQTGLPGRESSIDAVRHQHQINILFHQSDPCRGEPGTPVTVDLDFFKYFFYFIVILLVKFQLTFFWGRGVSDVMELLRQRKDLKSCFDLVCTQLRWLRSAFFRRLLRNLLRVPYFLFILYIFFLMFILKLVLLSVFTRQSLLVFPPLFYLITVHTRDMNRSHGFFCCWFD